MASREGAMPEIRSMESARCWTMENLPVLQMSFRLPQAAGQDAASRRFCRYYQLQKRAFLRRCERCLLPQTQAVCRAALADGVPPPCFQAELDFRVTRNRDGICSLITCSREKAGPGPAEQWQWGDTWDLRSGRLLPLTVFFPAGSSWKHQLLSAATAAINARESTGITRYLDSWPKQLKRSFQPRDFYLTETGLCFFYGMHRIAPALEGIPTFSLPYDPAGPSPIPVRS